MRRWSGQVTLAPRWPNYVCALVLSAEQAKSVTVPPWANWVLFSGPVGKDFFVSYTGTAFIPSSDVTDGTACEQTPGVRNVAGLSTISVIMKEAGVVTLAFFS